MEKDIEINGERNAQKNRLLHLPGSFLVIFTTISTHCKKNPPTHLWSPKCIQRRRDPAKPPRCESPGTESHKKKNECLFGRDTWKKSNLKKEAELLVVRLHWLILFVFNKMALGWPIIAIMIPKKSTSPPLFLQKTASLRLSENESDQREFGSVGSLTSGREAAPCQIMIHCTNTSGLSQNEGKTKKKFMQGLWF